MQETRYEGQIVQKVYSGLTEEKIQTSMTAALRPGEEVIRRRELTQAEFNGFNRHERRMTAGALSFYMQRGIL